MKIVWFSLSFVGKKLTRISSLGLLDEKRKGTRTDKLRTSCRICLVLSLSEVELYFYLNNFNL